MPSFSIFQFTILLGPLRVSAEFLLLPTGPTLDGTDSSNSSEKTGSHSFAKNKKKSLETLGFQGFGGDYWTRTSDLLRVKKCGDYSAGILFRWNACAARDYQDRKR